MRKLCLLMLSFLLAGSLSAAELYWYLGASMTKPGREVVKKYNAQSKDTVYLILGGSGQILNQLVSSGKGDIYTPASSAFLKKSQEKGLVRAHRLLLEQTPVFGLSKAAAGRYQTFEALVGQPAKIGVGNPKTMALGRTYLRIEKKMDKPTATALRKKIVIKAVNISQIVNYLQTGTIDAGTIFDSVARANQLTYLPIPEAFNIKVQAHFVKINLSQFPERVDAFEKFVFSQNAIFAKYGFQLKNN